MCLVPRRGKQHNRKQARQRKGAAVTPSAGTSGAMSARSVRWRHPRCALHASGFQAAIAAHRNSRSCGGRSAANKPQADQHAHAHRRSSQLVVHVDADKCSQRSKYGDDRDCIHQRMEGAFNAITRVQIPSGTPLHNQKIRSVPPKPLRHRKPGSFPLT
jgi:hypothetical protein